MNLDYLPETKEGHMIPNQGTLDMWKSLHEKTNYTHLFEIGLNGGHSAAINLELFPNVKVTSLDINKHKYAVTAANTLKEKFDERFDYIFCDSRAYAQRVYKGDYEVPKDIDMVFIDGGHDFSCLLSDIALSKFLNLKELFVDNTSSDFRSITKALDSLERLDVLEPLEKYKYVGVHNKGANVNEQLTHYRFI
jgi:precorrin-6B methylase 2